MEIKDLFRAVMGSDTMPQVLVRRNNSFVPAVVVEEQAVAQVIAGLSRYEGMLLKLRIGRHSREASYWASHSTGKDSVAIKKNILLAEFWGMLAKIAAPHFKK